MSRPFQPPSTQTEAIEQLRNLHNKCKEFNGLSQLASGASNAEIISAVNRIIGALQSVTKDATPARRA